MTTKRQFMTSAAAIGVSVIMAPTLAEENFPPISPVGISSAGMGSRRNGLGVVPPLEKDSIAFVEYCRSIGAGGVQFAATGDLRALRKRLDQLGMWFEGNASPPRTIGDSTEAFEKSLRDTLDAGGNVVRYVSRMPPGSTGRRYESFKSFEQFESWRKEADAIVLKCLPIAEKLGVKIALENHKDRTSEQHAEFLRKVSSEYLGALIDPGNNLALLELPEETCARLAPYVLMVSMKEMGVATYEDGFLLSEVRLGEGATDQLSIWKMLRAKNPKLRYSVEMITRDPLKVPCLTPGYWASMPDYSASRLSGHMQWVRAHTTKLPYVDHLPNPEQLKAEEDNNRSAIEWGRRNII